MVSDELLVISPRYPYSNSYASLYACISYSDVILSEPEGPLYVGSVGYKTTEGYYSYTYYWISVVAVSTVGLSLSYVVTTIM